MNETSILEQLLNRIDSLYSLPATAVEVLRITDPNGSDSVDYQSLKDIIERDAALSAKVMRAANTPVFGFGRQVSNLPEALRILGTQALRGVVLSFNLPQGFAPVGDEVTNEFWRRTVTRSIAARECARLLGEECSETVFLAGLLADIGMLALLQELEEHYLEFIREAKASGHDLAEMEIASLGFDHRTLSARLLDRWGLPESIVRLIGNSRLLDGNASLQLDQFPDGILYAADLASEWLTDNGKTEEDVLRTCQRFFEWNVEQVHDWMNRSTKQFQDLGDLLEVSIDIRQDYQILLDQAAERLDALRGDSYSDDSNEPEPEVDSPQVAWRDRSETGQGAEPEASATNDFFSVLSQRIEEHPEGSPDQWVEDPGLVGRVSMAIQSCRMGRKPMSLILLEIDDFDSLIFSESVDGIYRVQQSILVALQRLSRDERGEALEVTDKRFALLLPGLERNEATRIGKAILQLIRQWSQARYEKGCSPVSLSMGCSSVPIPAKNFDPKVLILGAQRCLESVQLGTGNGLKSIDVFY